jgi:hypothetical protein
MLKGLGGRRLAVSRLAERVNPDPNGNRKQRRAAKKIVRRATK